tara:strand:- start:24005 stop:24910 length:906 start_codon:yes stop_codon:yes gene_type:complete
MNVNWKGVYPALTTKFSEKNEIDIPAFLFNIKKQVEAGVHGVVIGGSLGEASTLTQDEKNKLLDATVGNYKGEIPVIMNIAESSSSSLVKALKDAKEYGANGLMMLPPMRYLSDERETLEFFKLAARTVDLPIMVYNNPYDYKIEITLDMFEHLSKYDNIQSVKESTRDVTNVTRMRNHFGDRFKILCGVDTLALEELLLGADGWVAGLVDAFPRETVLIYELVQMKRFDEARDLYRWFMPLLELDIHPKLVQYIKLAEVATGIGTEEVRPPRLKLVGDERERVKKIIEKAIANRPSLPTL